MNKTELISSKDLVRCNELGHYVTVMEDGNKSYKKCKDSSSSVKHLKDSFTMPDLGFGVNGSSDEIHVLTLEGVGFQGDILTDGGIDGLGPDVLSLNVGFAHGIKIVIPPTVYIETGRVNGSPALFRTGLMKGDVETFKAEVRRVKPASAYKKRGIGTPKSWTIPRKVVKK
jgi:hypothetical protein